MCVKAVVLCVSLMCVCVLTAEVEMTAGGLAVMDFLVAVRSQTCVRGCQQPFETQINHA